MAAVRELTHTLEGWQRKSYLALEIVPGSVRQRVPHVSDERRTGRARRNPFGPRPMTPTRCATLSVWHRPRTQYTVPWGGLHTRTPFQDGAPGVWSSPETGTTGFGTGPVRAWCPTGRRRWGSCSDPTGSETVAVSGEGAAVEVPEDGTGAAAGTSSGPSETALSPCVRGTGGVHGTPAPARTGEETFEDAAVVIGHDAGPSLGHYISSLAPCVVFMVDLTPVGSVRSTMKTVTINAADAAQLLLDSGLLGEINRVVLHPRGLALSVQVDDNDRVVSVSWTTGTTRRASGSTPSSAGSSQQSSQQSSPPTTPSTPLKNIAAGIAELPVYKKE